MTDTTENMFPPLPPLNIDIHISQIGDGKFEYIKSNHERMMLANAFEAISSTNNWDFVNRNIDSFMFSSDERTKQIYNKMEELGFYGHSGCSFGITMRNMQFLIQNGENAFKNKLIRD